MSAPSSSQTGGTRSSAHPDAGRPDRDAAALNLAAGVFRFARSHPRAAALVVDGRPYTYAELAELAARVATWLGAVPRPQGRAPRVGILAARSLETYAGILGAAWAGTTYVPLHPKQPPARLASILARAGLDALVVDERGALQLDDARIRAGLPKLLLVSGATPAAEVTRWDSLPETAGNEPARVGPEHPAYIMFTSGTTGVPKGVIVTAANTAHFLAAMRSLYGIGPQDRAGQFCETSFDVSVFEMFATWDGGASLHVVPESKLMAPAGFIRQQELTIWTSVPSVISLLARMKMLQAGSLPSLRLSFFIGEALDANLARAWQAAAPNSVVDNQYGPTEATVACTLQRVTDPVVETPGRGTVAIGRPYDGLDADIVDDNGGFVLAGTTGELALFGPQLAAGYLDDDRQTARRFPTLDHARHGRSRWYLTGDLACRDADGTLHCLGRIDHQVKIMGHRVELEDVEAHLRAASGSDAVAAVAWPIVDGNATGIVAFVAGSPLAAGEIRERLIALVPLYMLPRQVRAIDALPLSPNGKIDRIALKKMLEHAS